MIIRLQLIYAAPRPAAISMGPTYEVVQKLGADQLESGKPRDPMIDGGLAHARMGYQRLQAGRWWRSACNKSLCFEGANHQLGGDWRGLDWLEELVAEGHAVLLGGDGYPCWFTAQAKYLIQTISDGPPNLRYTYAVQRDGKPVIKRATAKSIRPEEWLLVEAWDQS